MIAYCSAVGRVSTKRKNTILYDNNKAKMKVKAKQPLSAAVTEKEEEEVKRELEKQCKKITLLSAVPIKNMKKVKEQRDTIENIMPK